MTKELGKKRVCANCKTKFYDFFQKPIICPNCSEEYDEMFFLKKGKASKKHEVIEEEFEDIDTELDFADEDLLAEDSNIDVSINKNVYSEDEEE